MPYGVGVARIRTAFTPFESVMGPLQLLNLALILVQSARTPYSRVLFGLELLECGANTGNPDAVQRPLRSMFMGSFPCECYF